MVVSLVWFWLSMLLHPLLLIWRKASANRHKLKTSACLWGTTCPTCKPRVLCCSSSHKVFSNIERMTCTQKLISSGDIDVCPQSLAPCEISVLGGGLSACMLYMNKVNCKEFLACQKSRSLYMYALLYLPFTNLVTAAVLLFSCFFASSNGLKPSHWILNLKFLNRKITVVYLKLVTMSELLLYMLNICNI